MPKFHADQRSNLIAHLMLCSREEEKKKKKKKKSPLHRRRKDANNHSRHIKKGVETKASVGVVDDD